MNDNDETYSTLGFTTLLILNRLTTERALRELAENEQDKSDGNAKRTRDDEERDANQAAYVEQRLRELAIWERRVNGNKKRGT